MYILFPYRHLSDEGIKECVGSVEKASVSDIIRIALNVSKSLNDNGYVIICYLNLQTGDLILHHIPQESR